jgi:hypothetical protein
VGLGHDVGDEVTEDQRGRLDGTNDCGR